jgi:hypothetical protein
VCLLLLLLQVLINAVVHAVNEDYEACYLSQ